MITDCMEKAQKFHECQVLGVVLNHQNNLIHRIVTSLTFMYWGIDNLGLIDPPSSKDNYFFLATTSNISKWTKNHFLIIV